MEAAVPVHANMTFYLISHRLFLLWSFVAVARTTYNGCQNKCGGAGILNVTLEMI